MEKQTGLFTLDNTKSLQSQDFKLQKNGNICGIETILEQRKREKSF